MDLSAVDRSSENAKIHGAVVLVSPMKKSKLSNDGHITDGKRKMRMVEFIEKQQKKLFHSLKEAEPVTLSNCEIVKSSHSDDMEIMLKAYTKIDKSPARFSTKDVDEIKKELGSIVHSS